MPGEAILTPPAYQARRARSRVRRTRVPSLVRSPFPEKVDLRSHRPCRVSPALVRRTAGLSIGMAAGPLHRASARPHSFASLYSSTSTSGLETRNVPGSIFRGPCSDPAPFPFTGVEVCAPAHARPSARKGACHGADEPALRDLEEGPGVWSEVERTGDKERSCSFFSSEEYGFRRTSATTQVSWP